MSSKPDSNPLKMNSKIKGEDLIAAVKAQDTAKLVEYASENKSKKQQAKIIISFTTKGSPNKSKSSPSKKVCMEVSRIIQASIDIAFAMLDNNLTLPQDLLHMLVFFKL
ncbi:hypothetical protein CEXT_216611 [Caerostris extrusa]|uniref:Uncharacterized protein n=1 Tax=Caerostris extrusa TaxID=172846 RepID=A0AAV4QSU2_CAEEX|nr:hypothetical protein CEXT_216611 [Caerostris extrusa]